MIGRRSFPDRQEARTAIFDYIEASTTRTGSTRRSATAHQIEYEKINKQELQT